MGRTGLDTPPAVTGCAHEANNAVDEAAETSYGDINTYVEITGQASGSSWFAGSAHAVDGIRSALRVFRVVQSPSKYPAHGQGEFALQKKVVAGCERSWRGPGHVR